VRRKIRGIFFLLGFSMVALLLFVLLVLVLLGSSLLRVV